LQTCLHSDNADRKEADSSITEEALILLREYEKLGKRKSTVVYQPHWHKGVVGDRCQQIDRTLLSPYNRTYQKR
jgi:single-stranded DNA-specific DHH superfamily exonuclease